MGAYAAVIIPLEDLHQVTQWLTELTERLQRAQQILYTARGSLIHAKAKPRTNHQKAKFRMQRKRYKLIDKAVPKKLLQQEDHRSQRLKLCRRRHA
jgi:hypothetical protein